MIKQSSNSKRKMWCILKSYYISKKKQISRWGFRDLGREASSVWNFCARFSDIIPRRHLWWRQEMSAVFSGFARQDTKAGRAVLTLSEWLIVTRQLEPNKVKLSLKQEPVGSEETWIKKCEMKSYFELRIQIWKWPWSWQLNEQPKQLKKNLKKTSGLTGNRILIDATFYPFSQSVQLKSRPLWVRKLPDGGNYMGGNTVEPLHNGHLRGRTKWPL